MQVVYKSYEPLTHIFDKMMKTSQDDDQLCDVLLSELGVSKCKVKQTGKEIKPSDNI